MYFLLTLTQHKAKEPLKAERLWMWCMMYIKVWKLENKAYMNIENK